MVNISGGIQATVEGKTDDIYKDRIENKKTWTEVCICFQEGFETPGYVKNAVGEYCHNLFNTAN